MRYATGNNFTGRKIPGYRRPECILLRPVAEALKRVQTQLKKNQLSLKVYDCYRPVRAVQAFMKWAQGDFGSETRKRFHPKISKPEVLTRGYVATRSSHSRGIAVDITLVPLPSVTNTESFDPNARYGPCTAEKSKRAPDNSVDMGTAFDCFDVRSHTWNQDIAVQQRNWRMKLLKAMQQQNFENYDREWWHFSLKLDGYTKHHNFAIDGRR